MDLFEEVMDEENLLAEQVSISDGCIVINVSYKYDIDLTSCDTAEKLLHWVWHLTEKTWMTNNVMRRFIDVACSENSINLVDVKI